MKEYVKPDLEVVKIRVEESFADNTTVYDLRNSNVNKLALDLERFTLTQQS